MQRYFPFIPKENLIRIHRKELFKMDVLIEDCMENLKKHMYDRIIFDCPYNQDKRIDYIYNIHRVFDWDEVTNVINKLNEEE
jgi:5'(3')-deoxyribonucleotidase